MCDDHFSLIYTLSSVSSSVSFEAQTLVAPVISNGNVGQLALDLIISASFNQNSDMEKVAHLESDDLLPIAAYDSFQSGKLSLCSNAEVFQMKNKSVSLLQLRSPVNQGCEERFAQNFMSWLKSAGFVQLVLLAGAEGFHAPEGSSGFRYESFWAANYTANEKNSSLFKLLTDSALPTLLCQSKRQSNGELPAQEYVELPPGSGTCKDLFKLGDSLGIPVIALFKYCNEGNNIQDGIELATALLKILPVQEMESPIATITNDMFPASWSSIFGGSSGKLAELY